MYRELGNSGAWRGTDINYVVITLPSRKKRRYYNFIVSLLSLTLLLPIEQWSVVLLSKPACRFRYSNCCTVAIYDRRFLHCGLSARETDEATTDQFDQL